MLPKEALAEVEKELEGKGRVVLRASGTEPVVRVMVEAKQADWAKKRRRKNCRCHSRSKVTACLMLN